MTDYGQKIESARRLGAQVVPCPICKIVLLLPSTGGGRVLVMHGVDFHAPNKSSSTEACCSREHAKLRLEETRVAASQAGVDPRAFFELTAEGETVSVELFSFTLTYRHWVSLIVRPGEQP